MAKKIIKPEIEHKKWEVHYETDGEISIWRYDSKNSMVNPTEVEILYKNDKSDNRKIANIKKSSKK